jgi:ATP synthase protein I
MLKVIAGQFGLGTAVAVLLWSVLGTVAGYSALLGMLVAAVPNMFLALRLSVPRRDGEPKGLVRAAYIGELGKLALTVLFFSIVFAAVRPLAAGPFFATFIVTAMVPLAGLLFSNDRYETQETVDRHGE